MIPQVGGFRLYETLHEGKRMRVYRGVRERDLEPVVLKSTVADADLRDIARLRNEAELLRVVGGGGAVRLLDEVRDGARRYLVLEDIGGRALRELVPMPSDIFLETAIAVAGALGRVHAAGVTHRDLNPSNIVLNEVTGALDLIDFELGTALAEDAPTSAGGGTLPYQSPEQTGRTGLLVDYRTDFYSLGATFYEMLTGLPPFVSEDPLELVHCHLARRPVPPCERIPSIHPALSAVVMRLLEKDPDARYQSAAGLAFDLEACREALQRGERHVELGRADFPSRLRFSHRLYGRDVEVAQLEAAFDEASRGRPGVLVLRGPAGVGKSALLSGLRPGVLRAGGAFVQGTCVETHRSVPAWPLAQALETRVGQLLAGSPAALDAWRSVLQQAVGELGRVAVETVPGLERIVGPQPEVPQVPPDEARVRHQRVLARVVQALAVPEAPLVVHLDDLQWADAATLSLLPSLAALDDGACLLLLLSWRSEAPLGRTLDALRDSGARVEVVDIADLEPPQIRQMLADTLGRPASDVAELGEIVHEKTRGNPFFLRQFLGALHDDGLLRFDAEARLWTWATDAVRAASTTQNVADLVRRRVHALPAESVQAIAAAACIGARFDVGLLAAALELPPPEVARRLRPALQEGLLLAIGDGLQVLVAAGDDGLGDLRPVAEGAVLSFVHARVRDAAAGVLDDDARMRVHLAVGRRLRERMGPLAEDERLFEVLAHLAESLPLVPAGAEAEAVARLMLEGGRRALRTAASDTAAAWLEGGLSLLGGGGSPPLALELRLEAALAASVGGQADAFERHLGEARRLSRTRVERARVVEMRLRDEVLRGRYPEAVACGREAMGLLGYPFPADASPVRIVVQLARTLVHVGRVGVERLPDLPLATDPAHILGLHIMTAVGTPAMLSRPSLLPLGMLMLAERSARYGLTSGSPGGMAGCGAIVLLALGRIGLAERLARAALRMAERFPEEPPIVKGRFAAWHMVLHWREPWRPIADWTERQVDRCLARGDVEDGTAMAWAWLRMSYQCGRHLPTLQQEMERRLAQQRRLTHAEPPPHWDAMKRVLTALDGRLERPGCLDSDDFDALARVAEARRVADAMTAWTIAYEQAWMHVVFERPMQALPYLEALDELVPSMLTLPEVPHYRYLDCLVNLCAMPQLTPSGRRRASRRAARSLSQLRRFAAWCPANHEHRVALVEGLLAQSRGDAMRATEAFERAAATAGQHGFLQDEALALDLCGRFQASLGRERLARGALGEARAAWQRWGCVARVRDLDDRYGALLGGSAGPASSTRVDLPALDLTTVVKASHAISGQIVLPLLLQRMVEIAIENAGARRGFLVLRRHDRLVVEVDGDVDRTPLAVARARGLDETEGIATAVVHYVARTQTTVVLDDASRDPRFAGDPYLRRGTARSVLCTPIVSQGRLIGVMYLENDLAAGIFTEARREVLGVLAAQAAISYENARLYGELQAHRNELEARVLERTEELHLEKERLEETLVRLRRAQDEVVAQQKLAYLGRMAAGIAHEIKNPLNFVINFSAMAMDLIEEMREMLRALPGGDPALRCADETAVTVGRIREHGERIDRVMRSMLLHAGSSSGVKEPADLNALVSQTVELAQKGASDPAVRRVDVGLEIDPALPRVQMAPRDIARALLNVVTNALLAAAQGGGHVRVSTGQGDGCVQVHVDDDGPGVAPEVADQIFSPFFTTRPAGQGTGLGLSISWDIIVGQHGGRLTVDSEAGRLTRFTISLPLGTTPLLTDDAGA